MIVSKNGKGGEEIATTLTTAKEQPLPRKEKAAASIRFGSGWDTCVLPDHRRIARRPELPRDINQRAMAGISLGICPVLDEETCHWPENGRP